MHRLTFDPGQRRVLLLVKYKFNLSQVNNLYLTCFDQSFKVFFICSSRLVNGLNRTLEHLVLSITLHL
jgi:hypothetical protein